MKHIEEWKDVVGWEGLYKVSNTGKVYSCYAKKERKLSVEKLGYASVDLWDKRHMKRVKVHRLVALAFLDNPDNKQQVNHKDGNKLNNNVENLEWSTAKENSTHAYDTGLSSAPVGERHGRVKLTELEAAFIKVSKDSNARLATEFGVSSRLVRKIKNGDLWKCLNEKVIYVNPSN